MLRATLRSLAGHKLRLLLTGLAILLGVSFISGTYVLTDTIQGSFDTLFGTINKGVDVAVRSSDRISRNSFREPVPDSVLETVRGVDGVGDVEGNVFSFALIVDKNGKAITTKGAPTAGLPWGPNDDLSALRVKEGKRPTGPNEVAIDAATFKKKKFAIGDKIKVVTLKGSADYTLVGAAGFGEEDNFLGATLAAWDPETAREVLRPEGWDDIRIQAKNGVDAVTLRDRIQAVLPAGYESITGEDLTKENTDDIAANISGFNIFLQVFGYIAMFVGCFIIANTFSIIVSQRRREMALMRALGAGRGQVMGSVMLESLIVGIIMSAIGVLAGVGLAIGLKGLFKAIGFDLPASGIVFKPRTIIVGMIVGVIATLVSALFPAWRASRVAPVAAMRDEPAVSARSGRVRMMLGTVLLIAGIVLLFLGQSDTDLKIVGFGALATVLALIMVAPVLARPVARIVGAPMARKIPGQLARQNAGRSARRTASAASALMIGLALVTVALMLSSSLKSLFGDVVNRGAKGDLVLQADGQSQQGFSPAALDAVRKVPGVTAAYGMRFGEVRAAGSKTSLTAVAPAAVDPKSQTQVVDIELRQGDINQIETKGVAVRDKKLESKKWKLGDSITFEFPNGKVDLPIVAVYHEQRMVFGSDYLISQTTFEKQFVEQSDAWAFVKSADGRTAELQKSVKAVIDRDFPGIKVQTRDEFVKDFKKQADQFLAFVFILLFLTIIIAGLGVINLLVLSVLERTRELGLVRAVGMSRRQMKRMVRTEGVIISVFGGILGIIAGLAFGWAFIRGLRDQGFDKIVVNPASIVMLLIAAGVVGILASAIPARRAAKLNILDAIHHD